MVSLNSLIPPKNHLLMAILGCRMIMMMRMNEQRLLTHVEEISFCYCVVGPIKPINLKLVNDKDVRTLFIS